MPQDFSSTIDRARDLTIQSEARGEGTQMGGLSVVFWMARAGALVSPWWSPKRDMELRQFWKRSDHLSGAIYTMQSKMTAIPFKIVARDQSNKRHMLQAESLTEEIKASAEWGEGWTTFYGEWIEDLLTQDNGAFAEIIGTGNVTGPLTGPPVTIAHLDSFRCQRTGNPEFPVLYQDIDGKQYKLHYTRVLYASQMKSPIAEMYGVGFSAVSRCINVAQTLTDILYYKQEKLGSRPHRAFVVTKGGLDPNDVAQAVKIAESQSDAQGLSRYSKLVVMGSQSLTEAGLDVVELSSLPDGFDEETSIILGMATVALAFGVDARELFPAMTAGATRADALLQHIKQRGKGPGQIIELVENAFNHKYLPAHLKMVFDYQDDAQDRQVSDIKLQRAKRRQSDLLSGAANVRTVREQMLEDGELTHRQFEMIELDDGRLADGSSVLALFYSNDDLISRMLDLGVKDPLDVNSNNVDNITKSIHKNEAEANKVLVNTSSPNIRFSAQQALAALKALRELYEEDQAKKQEQEQQNMPGTDTRLRTVDATAPNPKTEMSTSGKHVTLQDAQKEVENGI
jgi:hypothetical protein